VNSHSSWFSQLVHEWMNYFCRLEVLPPVPLFIFLKSSCSGNQYGILPLHAFMTIYCTCIVFHTNFVFCIIFNTIFQYNIPYLYSILYSVLHSAQHFCICISYHISCHNPYQHYQRTLIFLQIDYIGDLFWNQIKYSAFFYREGGI